MSRPMGFKNRERREHDDHEREEEKGPPPTPANRVFCQDGFKDGQGPWRMWNTEYKLKRWFTEARNRFYERKPNSMVGSAGSTTRGLLA